MLCSENRLGQVYYSFSSLPIGKKLINSPFGTICMS
jgi:hypothetical protein